MSNLAKINLSAMVKKEKDSKKNEKIDENIAEETTTSALPKISIWSIRTSKLDSEKEEIKEDKEEETHESMEEELEETFEENKEQMKESEHEIMEEEFEETFKENKKEVEQSIDVKIETKEKKSDEDKSGIKNENVQDESIEEIEAKINKKVDEDLEKKLKWKIETKKTWNDDDENKELFWNYQSEFTKDEESIIKEVEVKKLKLREKLQETLRKPRTRFFLLASLILITISIISGLFILNPEKYSIAEYKVSILNNVDSIKTNYLSKPWIIETIEFEGNNFEIQTQKKFWWDITYKYNEIIYITKDELNIKLSDEVRIKNEEIARIKNERIRIEAERLKIEAEKREKDKVRKALEEKFKKMFNK